MTNTAPRLDRRGRAAQQAERQRLWAEAEHEPVAWYAGSTLLSGVLVLGGSGWLLERWLGWSWLVPVGVVLGMAAAMTTLWFRYGVARPPEGGLSGTSTDAGPRDRASSTAPHRTAPRSTAPHRPTDRCPREDAP
jgi:ATP synthase protein I